MKPAIIIVDRLAFVRSLALFCIFAAGCATTIHSELQHAFVDALSIETRFASIPDAAKLTQADLKALGEVSRTLSPYLPDSASATPEAIFGLARKANPFLEYSLSKLPYGVGGPSVTKTDMPTRLAETDSIPPMSDVTQPGPASIPNAFADAFAKFLIDRARIELIDSFIQNYRSVLNDYPEIAYLMPSTNSYLVNNLSNAQVDTILASLSRLSQVDLENLPSRLATLDQMDAQDRKQIDRKTAYHEILKGKVGLILTTFSTLYKDFSSGSDFRTIVLDLAENAHASKWEDALEKNQDLNDAYSSLIILSVLLESFYDPAHEGFASEQDVAKFCSQPRQTAMFIGLVFQCLENDSLLAKNSSVQSRILAIEKSFRNVEPHIDSVVDFLGDFMKLLSATNDTYSKWSQASTSGDKKAMFSALVSYCESLRQFLSSTGMLYVILPDADTLAQFQKNLSYKYLIDAVGSGIDLTEAVVGKDYISALHAAIRVFKDIANDPDLTRNEYIAKRLADACDKMSSAAEFVAAIAGAQNSDEMAKVIDAYALPPSSYKNKYNTRMNLVLNAYLGFAAAAGSDTNAFGAYAPLGIAWNIDTTCYVISSFTLFVGVVDVGSLVTYRVQNGTAALPAFDVRSLFSPSASIGISLFRSPVSLFAGYRSSPKVESFSSSSVTYSSSVEGQWFAVVAVDIPIWGIAELK